MRKPVPQPAIPEPGQGKRGGDGHLPYLLRQANTALRAAMDRALADLGITPPQFAVLTMVAAYPGLSGADLARLSLLTPQTVSLIVTNLKRARAIESRAHAVHGRIQQLTITKAGNATLIRCKQRVARLETQLVSGMAAQDEAAIRRWLTRVAVDCARM